MEAGGTGGKYTPPGSKRMVYPGSVEGRQLNSVGGGSQGCDQGGTDLT